MIPLYTNEEYKNSKSETYLPLQCECCKKTFYLYKKYITSSLKGTRSNIQYCSNQCRANTKKTKQKVKCKQCGKTFDKFQKEIIKSPNHFCSKSCAAIYHNTHKTQGTRRSKFEIYIEEQLTILYPNLPMDFNKKDAINSELDIYIPSLKIAFEFNGIFHYEPIFGQDKLDKIQNNDERKFQACLEQNIEFVILDISSISYFKPEKCKKFLDIIVNIINKKIK